MKTVKHIFCAALAVCLLLSVMLTGCSAPKLVIGGTPDVAGTVNGEPLSTGEYLAYLYNSFYNVYYNSGYYQYAYYGYDAWGEKMTYGEGDDAQSVELAEYIRLIAKDDIARQVALSQMLKEKGIEWNADDLKEYEKSLKEMEKGAMLSVGISDENYIKVNKALSLNERSLFYGLYGEGGKQEVSEKERREYFDKNYLSYKIISIPMTNSEGKELDKDGKKKITDQLNGYLKTYNDTKNFEKVVDAYNKANAGKDEKVEASKDEDNRVNADATQISDEDLAEAIRKVKVGTAQVVEYSANGSTPTAALILRLDINNPKELFKDETENILYGMKYEAFDKEVDKAAAKVTVELKKSVVNACKPENFVAAQ